MGQRCSRRDLHRVEVRIETGYGSAQADANGHRHDDPHRQEPVESESRLMTGTEGRPLTTRRRRRSRVSRDYGSPQSQQHGAASDVARDSLAQHVSVGGTQ